MLPPAHHTKDLPCAPEHEDEAKIFIDLLSELKESRGIHVMMAMRALGIAHTKDTPVGDAMLR